MSELAQSVQAAVDGKKKRVRKAAAEGAAPKKARAPKAAKGPKAPKAPKPEKVKSETAGLRKAPKLKGLLLGTDLSRQVVLQALQGFCGATDAEKAEVSRLVFRLQARQD